MFSVFATLGDVLFAPRLSPSGLDVQQGAAFAEHALFSRAPRLQYTGRELDVLNLVFDLHFSFCTPAEEKKKLETMLRGHQAHPLVFGDGSWWGYFVLERLSTTFEQCSPSGTPWLISMQAELKEYTGDPAKPLERPAVSDGAPSLAVYPGQGSLLSLATPAAGGGLWDTMRTAVSFAQQARGIVSEATDLVGLARDVAGAGGPFEAVSLALGGADRLGGTFGQGGRPGVRIDRRPRGVPVGPAAGRDHDRRGSRRRTGRPHAGRGSPCLYAGRGYRQRGANAGAGGCLPGRRLVLP